ncbi:MAG: phosphoribosyl-ATP diphosphatase [Acidiferrobacteraceae bacterium]
MSDILARLDQVLEQRKRTPDDKSYVSGLYRSGLDTILKKLGEEATETVIAAKNRQAAEVVGEVADLWFHSLVMLSFLGLSSASVLNELGRRFGQSGLEEKASRKKDRE